MPTLWRSCVVSKNSNSKHPCVLRECGRRCWFQDIKIYIQPGDIQVTKRYISDHGHTKLINVSGVSCVTKSRKCHLCTNNINVLPHSMHTWVQPIQKPRTAFPPFLWPLNTLPSSSSLRLKFQLGPAPFYSSNVEITLCPGLPLDEIPKMKKKNAPKRPPGRELCPSEVFALLRRPSPSPAAGTPFSPLRRVDRPRPNRNEWSCAPGGLVVAEI